MNIQKQIKELQERNRKRYITMWAQETVPSLGVQAELLNELTADSFNQGALAAIEEIRNQGILPEIPPPLATDLPEQDYYHEVTYKQAHDTVRNHTLDYLKTLEAKIQEK